MRVPISQRAPHLRLAQLQRQKPVRRSRVRDGHGDSLNWWNRGTTSARPPAPAVAPGKPPSDAVAAAAAVGASAPDPIGQVLSGLAVEAARDSGYEAGFKDGYAFGLRDGHGDV